MVAGICVVELYVPASRSLKQKRQAVNSIKGRVRSRFNVSIAEVGETELWQRSTLALAYIGQGRGEVDSLFDKLLDFMDNLHRAEIIGRSRELLHFNVE